MKLVTGASGYIGGKLCSYLKEQGHIVRAVCGSNCSAIGDELISIDLAKSAISETLCAGVDTIFHLAGKAHALSDTSQNEEEYFSINVEGTRKLIAAAEAAGVQKFVFFSSLSVMEDGQGVQGDEPKDERSDFSTPLSAYGRSKLNAEELVLNSNIPHISILRPAMVYGEGCKGNLPRMVDAIIKGRFPPMPEFGNRRSMVHVGDLIQAAMLVVKKAEASGQTYIVTDGQAYSTRQMYEWICESLHKPVPGWHIPLFILKCLGKSGDVIGAVRRKRFIFDSDALEKLTSSAWYSSEKIQNELGFKPQQNLRESLPEIVSYLRANK